MQKLAYKSEYYGRQLVQVRPTYASSQICSACGKKNPKLRNLSIRVWTCPSCGAEQERDVNAAKNILNEGLRIANPMPDMPDVSGL